MGGFCLGLRLDQDQPVVAVHLAVCCWDLVLASFLAYQMILGIFPALTILWFDDIVLIISSGRSPSGVVQPQKRPWSELLLEDVSPGTGDEGGSFQRPFPE